MSDPKFYVELPGDEYGNTAMRPAVIQGRIVQGSPETRPFSNPAREVLMIDGPPDLVMHLGMYTDSFGGFAEVPGPARVLTKSEYDALIRSL
jgi:hypothetical protein